MVVREPVEPQLSLLSDASFHQIGDTIWERHPIISSQVCRVMVTDIGVPRKFFTGYCK
jgi:hypothetical protein